MVEIDLKLVADFEDKAGFVLCTKGKSGASFLISEADFLKC
jgi:hypothetical protein